MPSLHRFKFDLLARIRCVIALHPRLRWLALTALTLGLSSSVSLADEQPAPPVLKTATTHPMQYYLSLPQGWSATKRWPVVLIIESADRDFQRTSQLYAAARKHASFILVTPLVVTNGGPRFRESPSYRYSDQVWNRVETDGHFTFDMEGITAVMADVHKLYGGEDRYFLTGFEAGGHTLFAILFQHPERLRAAAPVCPNYAGRWVEESRISTAPERASLPIRCFYGAKDEMFSKSHPIFAQWARAKSIAREHGFKNISQEIAPGKGHEPLAGEVLAYFNSLLRR